MNDLVIREANTEDAERLVEIYSYYVLNTAVSFEYEVPGIEEFKERIRKIKANYPYLVCIKDDRIIGMINSRLALNDFLRKEGGHIGYSVRPTERRNGYGTDMLTEGLKVCNKIGIREVMVSCDKENLASAGVIKNCGGLLKEEFYSQTYDEVLQMYVINQ